jgi:hypothetical protein
MPTAVESFLVINTDINCCPSSALKRQNNFATTIIFEHQNWQKINYDNKLLA